MSEKENIPDFNKGESSSLDEKRKIVIIGDDKVGKSAIIKKFLENKFNEEYKATIMGEVFLFYTELYKKCFNFILYETSSEKVFKTLSHCIWKDSSWVILVYDITKKGTYDNIDAWIKELEENEIKSKIIIVGNKADLENRAVLKEEAEKKYGGKLKKIMECSATREEDVKKIFYEVSKPYYEQYLKKRRRKKQEEERKQKEDFKILDLSPSKKFYKK